MASNTKLTEEWLVEQLGKDSDKCREWLSVLHKEEIHTLSDLSSLEPEHWAQLSLPLLIKNRLQKLSTPAAAAPSPLPTTETRVPDVPQLPKDMFVTIDSPPRVSCLLLTVNDNELRGVLCTLKPLPGKTRIGKHTSKDGLTTYLGIMGKQSVVVANSAPGNNTVLSAGNTVMSCIDMYHPRVVIAVGVAFGKDTTKQKLGDVLVSTKVIDYSYTRESAHSSEHRGVKTEAGRILMDRFKNGRLNFHHDHPEGKEVTVFPAPMLTGPTLLDNPTLKAKLFSTHPEAEGGEMEALGVYMSASFKNTEWIIVKSICDWGDGTKNKIWQPWAAWVAALYVEHVLDEEPGIFLRGLPELKTENMLLLTKQGTGYSTGAGDFIYERAKGDSVIDGDLFRILRKEFDNGTWGAETVISVTEQHGPLLQQLLDVAPVPRVSIARVSKSNLPSLLQQELVNQMEVLINYALQMPTGDEYSDRVVLHIEEPATISFCLLRFWHSGDRYEVYNEVHQLPTERWASDALVEEETSSWFPRFSGDTEDTEAILKYLKQNGVKQEEDSVDMEQFEKAREWLRRYCVESKLMNPNSSYFMKHRVEEWNGDYKNCGYVSNLAMKVALVSMGYRLKCDPGSPNVHANVRILHPGQG